VLLIAHDPEAPLRDLGANAEAGERRRTQCRAILTRWLSAGSSPSTTAVTSHEVNSAYTCKVVANAVSAASRPVAMRTKREPGWVQHLPFPARPGLNDRVEVRRRQAGRVDGHESGGNTERPARRDRHVSKHRVHQCWRRVAIAVSRGWLEPDS
jgi:hypothetical protein